MNRRNLFKDPVWQAAELGYPIPDSRHAVSVALPRWEDVVGYEEKSPRVLSRMQCGYPRFVVHPLVQEVANRIAGAQPCLAFPSRRTAEDAAAFIQRQSGAPTSLVTVRGLHAVITNDSGAVALKNFWQHTGWITSSRQAEAWLAERSEKLDAPEIRSSLRQQLAGFYDCGEEDVFLATSGMAAQAEALRAVLQRTPDRPTVQMGFAYVDTLKLQQKLGYGAHLIHDLDHVESQLRQYLVRSTPAACFGEIPGNPLLGSVNLRRITPWLRAQGIPFVADDVVATPVNVDLSGHADLIATSLTKYIVGSGDAMAGALICNPRSPYYRELKEFVRSQHEELLWGEDARVLDAQARTFPARMQRHNQNGLIIAERLRAHPAVERVWYPKWEFTEAYEAVRRRSGGWGSLVTFLPRDAERNSPQIYDQLTVSKGPSLGTEFTLACPFTLLAHYTELDWAESCGVSRYLIRVSVGLEDVEELWRRFDAALTKFV